MLAYRAEDIHQRLEPQDLYVREELEESVQYDVAEDCILKWIQRFVKPVIVKQERHRRQTVSDMKTSHCVCMSDNRSVLGLRSTQLHNGTV